MAARALSHIAYQSLTRLSIHTIMTVAYATTIAIKLQTLSPKPKRYDKLCQHLHRQQSIQLEFSTCTSCKRVRNVFYPAHQTTRHCATVYCPHADIAVQNCSIPSPEILPYSCTHPHSKVRHKPTLICTWFPLYRWPWPWPTDLRKTAFVATSVSRASSCSSCSISESNSALLVSTRRHRRANVDCNSLHVD